MKHSHFEVTFEPGKVTLISGESESGKSSILFSILWCLYGKVQKVYRGETEKVHVSIELPKLIIYRQARPGRLKVTLKNTKDFYYGFTAQNIINQEFHSKDIWKACSFVEQKKLCFLLEAGYSERMKILTALAFDEEDPEKYIQKIEKMKEEIKKKYERNLMEYNVKIDIYTEQFGREINKDLLPGIKWEQKINEVKKEINKFQETKKELIEKIEKLESKLRTQKGFEIKAKLLKKRLDKTRENKDVLLGKFDQIGIKIEEVKTNIDQIKDEVKDLRESLYESKMMENKLKQFQNMKKEEQKLLKEFGNLEIGKIVEILDEDKELKNPTESYYLKVYNSEQKYNKNHKIVETLGLTYSRNIIDQVIMVYKKKVDDYTSISQLVPILKRIKEVEAEIKKGKDVRAVKGGSVKGVRDVKSGLSKGVDQLSDPKAKTHKNLEIRKSQLLQNLEKYSVIYEDMKRGVALLQCPKCDQSLRYLNRKLVGSARKAVTEIELKNQQKLISEINIELDDIKKDLKLIKKHSKLELELKKLNQKLINRDSVQKFIDGGSTPNKFKEWIQLLGILNQIEIVDKPKVSSVQIKLKMKLVDIKIKIKELGNIETSGSSLEIENKLRKLNKKLNILEKTNRDLIQTNNEIKILEHEIKIIELDLGLESKLKEFNTLKNNTENNLNNKKEFLARSIKLKELNNIKLTVGLTKKELDCLHKLQEKAVNLSCRLLEDTVENINQRMNPILEQIFDKSVLLELNLFKQLKVGKKVKQMVNLDVFFDAKKHEKRFCGGEQDRISISMLLALNQISRSPFILMDELLGTVSPRIANKCIKQIKRVIDDKTYAICVEHNVIKGRYDRVIHIGDGGSLVVKKEKKA